GLSAEHGFVAPVKQEQVPALHTSSTAVVHALTALPDRPKAATSSLHDFEVQSAGGGAALAPETKTPAASATVANMTASSLDKLAIEPPLAVSQPKSKIDFEARPVAGLRADCQDEKCRKRELPSLRAHRPASRIAHREGTHPSARRV